MNTHNGMTPAVNVMVTADMGRNSFTECDYCVGSPFMIVLCCHLFPETEIGGSGCVKE